MNFREYKEFMKEVPCLDTVEYRTKGNNPLFTANIHFRCKLKEA